MASSSSQTIRSESAMVPELCPAMPVDLFRAVMKGDGDGDVLIRRLGLQQTDVQVTIDDPHSAPKEKNTENPTVESKLRSTTRIGDTILHLLITKEHNDLALIVFKRDMSLLKARNNMSETPLYCAAKVGNEKVLKKLFQTDHVIVKDALQERNNNGDTALHVAARHGHGAIGRMLMNLDQEAAYKVNDKMESPLYMAITELRTNMVLTMLEVDPTLACTPFSDGMFPIHHVARVGNYYVVKDFFENYPNDVELRDSLGRNLFHIATEEKHLKVFSCAFEDASFRKKIETMITATNYEGDTPFHVAATKGHRRIMRAIWEYYQVAETVPNKNGFTPFELSTFQVAKTIENTFDMDIISKYVKTEGNKFTRRWFEDVMEPLMDSKDRWEKAQVVGLGSVLITTVAFAAAFTIPGGYNEDHGTPILGRRYMFRAFILANTLAFIQGSISLFTLLISAIDNRHSAVPFATISFVLALSSMIVTFGLGLYVTLSPVCYPIAVLVLVITLIFGSPAGIVLNIITRNTFVAHPRSDAFVYQALASMVVSFLIIFCLAFL